MSDNIEFRTEQVREMESELSKMIDENNRPTTVTRSMFARDYLPLLREMVNNPDFDGRQWLNLVGNYYAPLVVLEDNMQKVAYELPPLLDQGHTYSPDPDDMSLNDRLENAGAMRDTLPEVAIATKHRTHMQYTERNAEEFYANDYAKASKTVATINQIFKDYGIDTIPVPEGLDVDTSPKTTSPKKPTVDLEDDYTDGEML